MYILPDLSVKEMILALEADATIFPGGFKLHLYTNNVTPTKRSVIGDFTELTNVEVPGYAAQVPSWTGTPIRKPDGSWEDQGAAPIHFGATANPPAPQIVYGWYITDGASAVLAGAGLFDVPFTFSANGDGFDLEMVIRAAQTTGTEYTVTLDMEME